MSEIASLGVRIDSTDATRAAGELDKLTTAGTRSEEAAKRVQRSWEQAVQRIAAELNALNARVDVLNGTQSRMLAAVERTEALKKRMAEAYDRSARAADSVARAYGQVGREAGASAAGVDRVNRSLVQTETTATAAGASIRRHLLAALGGLSAMRLIDLADDWGQMASRILERKIELLQQMKGSQQTLERLDAEKAAWEQWSRDVEQIFDQVGQSLTDAIFEGGKSARDLVRDLFKTLTLRVLIQPMLAGLQGMVTNQIGGLLGYQDPRQQGGVGGMLQNASSLNSIFGAGYSGSRSGCRAWSTDVRKRWSYVYPGSVDRRRRCAWPGVWGGVGGQRLAEGRPDCPGPSGKGASARTNRPGHRCIGAGRPGRRSAAYGRSGGTT